MLSDQRIKEYQVKLEAERNKLIEELKKDEKPEDFGDDVGNPDEEANEAEAFVNQQARGQTLRDCISEIDAALNKIREGKFGLCENCGKQISEEVLSIIPESQLCETCKRK